MVPKFLAHRTLSVSKTNKWKKGKFGIFFPLDAPNVISKVVVDSLSNRTTCLVSSNGESLMCE